ncbi:MAG: L,D-transpeptidase [Anaerolineales bacterium]|nr:MAG: L,D-transpeptidase [Anaerolineales bacterium]
MKEPDFENKQGLSRRAILKAGLLGLGTTMIRSALPNLALPTFPEANTLGRLTAPKVDLYARPDATSQVLGPLYEDAVFPWLREVSGYHPYRFSQRFVESPDGFIWAANVQPVENHPQLESAQLLQSSLGEGMWVEVTTPYVDLLLENPPARSPWLKEDLTPRLYYSQILWVDAIVQGVDNGIKYYRINERFGYGDIFLAEASAFRPLTLEELSPIHPEVEDKRVVVDVTRQSLSCFEGNREVYYCRVSTGAKFNASGDAVDEWATPLGGHPIWRKVISLHMSGGTTGGGYDLPGIGWSTLFVGNGVAIHSTFWHNNFGVPMSHGCVNTRPDDAKWIFRWTTPHVDYDPGDVTISMPGGTRIEVVET